MTNTMLAVLAIVTLVPIIAQSIPRTGITRGRALGLARASGDEEDGMDEPREKRAKRPEDREQDRVSVATDVVDEAGLESFPASDPPAWTLGVAAPKGRLH